MSEGNINIILKNEYKKCNPDTISKQTVEAYFFNKINIYIKLTCILFIYYILKHIIFMLFVHLLINCIILTLKNVKY